MKHWKDSTELQIVLITAHIVFINKIMQNSIDFPSHILFGREINGGSVMQAVSWRTQM